MHRSSSSPSAALFLSSLLSFQSRYYPLYSFTALSLPPSLFFVFFSILVSPPLQNLIYFQRLLQSMTDPTAYRLVVLCYFCFLLFLWVLDLSIAFSVITPPPTPSPPAPHSTTYVVLFICLSLYLSIRHLFILLPMYLCIYNYTYIYIYIFYNNIKSSVNNGASV